MNIMQILGASSPQPASSGKGESPFARIFDSLLSAGEAAVPASGAPVDAIVKDAPKAERSAVEKELAALMGEVDETSETDQAPRAQAEVETEEAPATTRVASDQIRAAAVTDDEIAAAPSRSVTVDKPTNEEPTKGEPSVPDLKPVDAKADDVKAISASITEKPEKNSEEISLDGKNSDQVDDESDIKNEILPDPVPAPVREIPEQVRTEFAPTAETPKGVISDVSPASPEPVRGDGAEETDPVTAVAPADTLIAAAPVVEKSDQMIDTPVPKVERAEEAPRPVSILAPSVAREEIEIVSDDVVEAQPEKVTAARTDPVQRNDVPAQAGPAGSQMTAAPTVTPLSLQRSETEMGADISESDDPVTASSVVTVDERPVRAAPERPQAQPAADKASEASPSRASEQAADVPEPDVAKAPFEQELSSRSAQPLPDRPLVHPEAARMIATMRSSLAKNVAEQIARAPSDGESLKIRLKPQGMGIIEIEVTRDADGRREVSLRAQNPLVLEAMRAERPALSEMLSGQSRGDTLNMDLFRQGGGERGEARQNGGQSSRNGQGFSPDLVENQDAPRTFDPESNDVTI